MKRSDNEMAVILLCAHLGKDEEIKPLSTGEWHRFADFLMERSLEPSFVFDIKAESFSGSGYDKEFRYRIQSLTERGAQAAFELEGYEKRGILVTTYLEKRYPSMLRRVLKKKTPPLLYYAGDISLANKIGIGIVGSRNVSPEGFSFTESLARKAAEEKLVIYSGGARGVDRTAQSATLADGGAVVSYLADSLEAEIKKRDVNENVSSGRLLLISDQKPSAGFSAGRAMNRNKYIYASARGTFVVESDANKGGTWGGATEALKQGWGRVFVRDIDLEGNRELIRLGGIPYEPGEERLTELLSEPAEKSRKEDYHQMSLSELIKPGS